MKILAFIFVYSFFYISVYSQNISNQVKFKDIPIKGCLDEMIEKIKSLDYKFEEKSEDGSVAIFRGSFANEDCEIVLYASPKTKIMHSVIVNFKERHNWHSLKSKYQELKKQLMTKYNSTPKSREYFIDPYYEGDGYEIQALKLGKCYYFSTFNFYNGKIGLYIIEDKIQLLYQDFEGYEINKKEENEKSYDDL